jgi:pyruvate formate lyase activating enzyme
MKIGGFQKLSLIDYPGKIAAVIFTQGCDFRCPFCHNPELVIPDLYGKSITMEEIFDFLKKRVNKLTGVVITGGEPTLHADLPLLIKEIRDMGFAVKLDTNGNNPRILELLISSRTLDYIAMDIKSSPEKYPVITGRNISIDNINRSIDLIINSGIDYEFRTTLLKSHVSKDDLKTISLWVKGSKRYTLKTFLPGKKLIDNNLSDCESYSDDELADLKNEFERK